MKAHQSIYEELIEKVSKSSLLEVATRVVYEPDTGLCKIYYHDKLVRSYPYKTDIKWKDVSPKS